MDAPGNVAAQKAAALTQRIVAACAMPCAAVVPDQGIAHTPLMARLEPFLPAPVIDFVQKDNRFVIRHAENPDRVDRIDEDRLTPRVRMAPNHRMIDQRPLIDHPVIRRHPDTGRESVFVNPIHTVGILGMPDDEAIVLLDEIYDWCGQERFQARHQWRMGDTLIWDNRCTWHSASGDNPLRQRRRFLRGNIAGSVH